MLNPTKNLRMGPIAEAVFVLVTLAFAYQFTILRFVLNHEYERATVASLLSFQADVPFQYRALVPWIVNFIAPFLPPFHLPPNLWVATTISPELARAVVLVEMISTALLIFAFRSYLAQFLRRPVLNALLTFTIFYALAFNSLLPRFAPFWYPYDIPGLLFFTIGLTLLYKERWGFYYPLFIVATLNRETSALLTVIFLAVSLGKHNWKWILGHLVLQGGLWTMLKLLLYHLYGNNPGQGQIVEEHLLSNFAYLASPKYYPMLLSSIGFLWIPTLLFFAYIPDRFVRRCVLASLLLIPLVLYSGSVLELRVYLELIPIYLAAFLLILDRVFRERRDDSGTESMQKALETET